MSGASGSVSATHGTQSLLAFNWLSTDVDLSFSVAWAPIESHNGKISGWFKGKQENRAVSYEVASRDRHHFGGMRLLHWRESWVAALVRAIHDVWLGSHDYQAARKSQPSRRSQSVR
jgi:hypothetical protein